MIKFLKVKNVSKIYSRNDAKYIEQNIVYKSKLFMKFFSIKEYI